MLPAAGAGVPVVGSGYGHMGGQGTAFWQLPITPNQLPPWQDGAMQTKTRPGPPPNLPILTDIFFPLQLVCGGDSSYQSAWRDKIGVEQVEAVVWTSGCCTYRFWCLFKQNQYKQVGTKNPTLCTAGVCKLWYLLFKRFQACDLRLPIHVIFVMMSVFELGLSSSIIFRVFPCTGKVIISPHSFWEDFLPRLPGSTCSAFLLRLTEFIVPWKLYRCVEEGIT